MRRITGNNKCIAFKGNEVSFKIVIMSALRVRYNLWHDNGRVTKSTRTPWWLKKNNHEQRETEHKAYCGSASDEIPGMKVLVEWKVTLI
jgi:hypothetical protein